MLLLLMNSYNFGPTREPEYSPDMELEESDVNMGLEPIDKEFELWR